MKVASGPRVNPRITAILALVFIMGCSTPHDPLGADIREALGVTRHTAEETEDSIERNYDPNVILKRAEALYQQKDYIEAAGEYQHFLDLHPLHQWADYSQLKLGLSYFQQFTTIDRDSEPIQKALATFRKLITTYPKSKYIEEARKRIQASRERLAQHHFYVARFYYKKEAYPAAIHRLREILDSYSDRSVVGDSHYFLALSYRATGEMDQAKSHLEELIQNYPGSSYRTEAKQVLGQINGQSGP